jgi:hypothetical protein
VSEAVLKFHEGLACEVIVRHLERRTNSARSNLRWPEEERHPSPVEIVFTLGAQLYALEHTGIEPFKGHMRMDAEASRHYNPIVDALNTTLDHAAVFELNMPANAFEGRDMREIRRIQDALIAWVKTTAPSLPKRHYADYRGYTGPITVSGIPFPVSLFRFEPALAPGHHFHIKHVVSNVEELRTDRIRQAVDRKFPKLADWKRTCSARTILVLEDNDIQLTNQVIVAETFIPLARARPDRPDETYVVASCADPWHACPVLIDDRTYFELADQYQDDVCWSIDQRDLTPLTKR